MIIQFYVFAMMMLGIFLISAFIGKNKELIRRLLTISILWTILCAALFAGEITTGIFLTLLMTLGIYELAKNYKINFLVLIIGPFAIGAILFFYPNIINYYLLVFLIACVLPFIRKTQIVSGRQYAHIFSMGVIAPCILCLLFIYKININMICVIILALQFNDGFGYVFGKKFGKTKLFKILSPNKSLEGYVFGGIGLIIWMLILHTLFPVFKDYSFIQDLIFFVVIFVVGNMGDLLFSGIKRKIGVKDFGNILPGHGGVLDRIDNVLFTAPFFFVLVSSKIL